MGGHAAGMAKLRNSEVNPECERIFQRLGCKWADNVYLREARCEDVYWNHLAHDKV
jgi:hypothetical protein